ncbi:hypothetical protein D3C75_726180 [compost metagenome]
MFKKLKELFGSAPVERVEPVIIPEEPEVVEEVEEGTGNLTIRAISYDDDTGQIKIDMDWDEAFVEYLKRNGFNGATEESIVHKYVATLYQGMLARQQAEGKDYE